jgi:RND family efflux transporter MFP subunit
MRHHLLILGLACVAGAQMAGSLAALEGPQEAQPPKAIVKVAKPVVREIVDYEIFSGRVEPDATVELRPRVTGYVLKVLVEAGATVKRGDVLVEIDARVYQAQYDAAKANLALQEATFKHARATNERFKALAKNAAGAVTPGELNQNQALEDQAVANMQLSQAKLEMARLNLDSTKVTSPIDGKIECIEMAAGNLASADKSLLVTLTAVEPMHVAFDVDENTHFRLTRNKTGKEAVTAVSIQLTGDDGWTRQAKVDSTGTRVEAATGTVRWRAALSNKEGKLLPGQSARVRLAIGGPHQAILVAGTAIQRPPGEPATVLVVNKNVVEVRPVQLGQTQPDGLRAVSQGLTADDVLLVDCRQGKPGSRVEVELIKMPTGSR